MSDRFVDTFILQRAMAAIDTHVYGAGRLPVREFVSIVPLTAVAILALNDHMLKGAYPSWWTGKLSDIAGLIYFPLLMTALLNTARTLARWTLNSLKGAPRPFPVYRLHKHQLVASIGVTAVVFSAINLRADAMHLYIEVNNLFHRVGLIPPTGGTTDPSDLLALPALLISYWWGTRYLEAAGPQAQPGPVTVQGREVLAPDPAREDSTGRD